MRIDSTKDGIVLREVFSGVLLEQPDGNAIGICMRDDTFEINVIPKDGQSQWFRVDMQRVAVTSMDQVRTSHDQCCDPIITQESPHDN